MDHFRLQSIDTTSRPATAWIVPTMTFAGAAANVATGPRLKRVADTITQLLGQPVQADLVVPAPRGGPSSGSDTPNGGAHHGPSAGSGTSGGRETSGDGGISGGGGVDRRDALNLPLVRDVFEIFPDASLIDARKESPPPKDDA